jgi:hypothetical protein
MTNKNFSYRKNYIAINSDISNNTKIFIKGLLNDKQKDIINRTLNNEKRKNRIIISGIASGSEASVSTNIFINKYNLKNNIKFMFKNNDYNKARILFVKSNNDVYNNDLTLLDSSNNYDNLNNVYMIYKDLDINNNIINYNETPRFRINLNFYKNYKYNTLNSDYYKFKLNDFSLNNSTTITNLDIVNDYSNNKLINNYNISDFSNLLLYFYNNNFATTPYNITSDSIDINESSFNFLLYSKPSANNITSKTSNNYTKINFNNNESIIFLPFKNYDYYSNKAGKILFYKDCIHFNSLILDSCSNFYTNYYNKDKNISPYKYYDISNTIFLSLGNFMSGFTQKNLFKQTLLQNTIIDNNININKILFRSLNNKITIPSELTNNYLIEKNDYSYNYIFDNILYGYNNFNNLKNTTLDLTNYYYNNFDFSKNTYLNGFNNYNIKKNINDFNYEISNITFIYSDVCYNNNYKLNYSNTNNDLTFDFRYNYDISFNVNYSVNIGYNDNNNISIPNINFFKIDFVTNFNIPEGSLFNNVEEILIYYDPYSENTPAEFRYPNNNLDICRNFQLDFLNTVIENIPGALTSTTNTSFIPEKNSSNYSKKMINGLIGFNNVPKLLSIKPYDESILIGRGFNNQLNFDNGKRSTDELQLSDQERLDRKWFSQKYKSQNNNRISSKQQFANSVRSSRRIMLRGTNVNNYNSGDKPPLINNIECLNTISIVNIIQTNNGNKFVLNNSNIYYEQKKYGLNNGNYILTNISINHPIALLNRNVSNLITYSGNQNNKLNKSISGTNFDNNYDFYYGTISINVLGDFNQVSIYCFYHGYMGGENLLKYSNSCINNQ